MDKSVEDWQQGLEAVQQVFPQQNITLKNAGDGSMIKNLTLGLIWLILGVALFLYSGKIGLDVLQDRKLAENYVIVENAEVTGECQGNRKLPFVRGCDVEIQTLDGHHVKKDFFFLSTSKGDYEVEIIAQKDDPSNLNVDLAIKHMTARYITVAILAILGIAIFLLGGSTLLNVPRKNRLKKIMNDPANQPWEFIATPVEIYADSSMDFKTDIDGKLVALSIDIERNQPIKLSKEETEDDKTMVLAIKARNAPTFIPLTQKLTALNISKDEKNKITQVINEHFS